MRCARRARWFPVGPAIAGLMLLSTMAAARGEPEVVPVNLEELRAGQEVVLSGRVSVRGNEPFTQLVMDAVATLPGRPRPQAPGAGSPQGESPAAESSDSAGDRFETRPVALKGERAVTIRERLQLQWVSVRARLLAATIGPGHPARAEVLEILHPEEVPPAASDRGRRGGDEPGRR